MEELNHAKGYTVITREIIDRVHNKPQCIDEIKEKFAEKAHQQGKWQKRNMLKNEIKNRNYRYIGVIFYYIFVTIDFCCFLLIKLQR